MKILLQIAYLMLLILALTALAYSFNLPNQGKYKSFIERSRQVSESEIESARSAKTGRKASENKRPWLADSFLDMENMVDPDFGGRAGTLPYLLPDGTRSENPYVPSNLAGCALSAPPVWYVTRAWGAGDGLQYNVHVGILRGIVKNVSIRGPAKLRQQTKSMFYPVNVRENAADGSVVIVTMRTVSVRKDPYEKREGICNAKTIIRNEPCTCVGVVPSIMASSATIAPGGSVSLSVDSGGLACPNYTWSVSGAGYTILPATTENDLETIQLSSSAGNCEVEYGPYATVTVTDKCGVTDTAKIRNTGGQWNSQGNVCGVSATVPPGQWTGGAGGPYSAEYISGDEKQTQTVGYVGYCVADPCAPLCNGIDFSSSAWCNSAGYEAEGKCLVETVPLWCSCNSRAEPTCAEGTSVCEAVRTSAIEYFLWGCAP